MTVITRMYRINTKKNQRRGNFRYRGQLEHRHRKGKVAETFQQAAGFLGFNVSCIDEGQNESERKACVRVGVLWFFRPIVKIKKHLTEVNIVYL